MDPGGVRILGVEDGLVLMWAGCNACEVQSLVTQPLESVAIQEVSLPVDRGNGSNGPLTSEDVLAVGRALERGALPLGRTRHDRA